MTNAVEKAQDVRGAGTFTRGHIYPPPSCEDAAAQRSNTQACTLPQPGRAAAWSGLQSQKGG